MFLTTETVCESLYFTMPFITLIQFEIEKKSYLKDVNDSILKIKLMHNITTILYACRSPRDKLAMAREKVT